MSAGGWRSVAAGWVVLQPLQPACIGQVPDVQVFETGLESVAVGAGAHDAYHDRMVVLQPGVAHQDVVLVVEGVEDFDGVEPAHGFSFGPGEAGAATHRPRNDEQGDSRGAFHQCQHGEPAPSGDTGQVAGEKFDRGLPCGQGAAPDMMRRAAIGAGFS